MASCFISLSKGSRRSGEGRNPARCKDGVRCAPQKPTSTFNINININTAGGSPAASHFLLPRQKESNQRKGDPGLPPFGFPALLDWSGGCGTRATRSDSPRRNPLTSLRYSAALRGR